MVLTTIRSTYTCIGVDIGARGVRAVQLRRTGGVYAVHAVARSERTADADDGPLNRRLKSCLRSGEFHGCAVSLSLRAGDLEYHLIELPSAVVTRGDDEAAQAVRWEVASLMGDSVENVEARHWVTPPPSAPGPNTLAVGARIDAIHGAYEACHRSGVECRAIDAPATALCRVGCALRPPTPRSVWGLLDLGYEQTRLILCVDETPVLVRNIGPGGKAWTRRIAESLNISEKAAEIHKREHGIARAPRGVRDADTGDVPDHELGAILYGVLRSDLNDIAEETRRSFRYVTGCYAGREAEVLLLVGGGAMTKHLPEFLNEHAGVRVQRASDCLAHDSCRIQYSSGHGEPFEPLALATGLALPE